MSSDPEMPLAELGPLPDIDLRQMHSLTDGTGVLQHAAFATPDLYHGYCTDDNARALIAATLYSYLKHYDESVAPIQRYLAFLGYAFNEETGRYRNFMGYDRQWLEAVGSPDSHGRTIWALGVAVRYAPNHAILEMSSRLFHRSLPAAAGFRYVHPLAFTLIGLDEYLKFAPQDDAVDDLRGRLAERLFGLWRRHAHDDWPWPDDILTWGIAKLPHALIISGSALGRDDMLETGLRALRWCLAVQTAEAGHLSIVGNDGWYERGGRRAPFDQQPLEAHALVHACLAAAEISGERQWLAEARRCLEWFLGRNDLGVPLYHPDTGGCQDGLTPHGPNSNQGAESTLAYLLSVLEMHRYVKEHTGESDLSVRQKIGYGLIGASRFAAFCLSHYARVDGLELLAVWNRTTHKADALAGQHKGMRVVETVEDLLADPRIRMVHVATIPALHAQHATAALAAGKNVLCEKPLALNVGDADDVLSLARERGLQLSVDFMMRYGPLWEPVRKLIQSRTLGSVLHGQLLNCAGDEGLDAGHWFWDEARSGGIFVEHGVHYFDLLRSWLGGGSVVDGHRLVRPGTGLIDQVHCSVRYGEQTTVGFYHGFHQPTFLDRQDLRLVFETGELTLRGWIAAGMTLRAVVSRGARQALQELFADAETRVVRRLKGAARKCTRRGVREAYDAEICMEWASPHDGQTLYGLAVQALMEDLLEAVRDPQHRPRVTGEDGREAVAVALAADRMAKRGALR
ncbi:MAG: Gfo/Idh/MocA family oxidoreductase [Kiritimatiellae bacterium]|nr:Gfo/Idh/MocA family oxidoreductase [Kiritimatiellia bacterium]